MKVTQQNIGEVLQRIYDSEINIALGWCWDGGLTYSISGNPYPLREPEKQEDIVETGESDLVKALQLLATTITERYPNSSFTKWFSEEA